MSEADLQSACNAYLHRRGIRFFHDQKGRSSGGKRQRAGLPDLVIWPGKGRTLFVELKSTKGRLRTQQLEFRDWAHGNGYVFEVARSLEEFVRLVEDNEKSKQFPSIHDVMDIVRPDGVGLEIPLMVR